MMHVFSARMFINSMRSVVFALVSDFEHCCRWRAILFESRTILSKTTDGVMAMKEFLTFTFKITPLLETILC